MFVSKKYDFDREKEIAVFWLVSSDSVSSKLGTFFFPEVGSSQLMITKNCYHLKNNVVCSKKTSITEVMKKREKSFDCLCFIFFW